MIRNTDTGNTVVKKGDNLAGTTYIIRTGA